MQELRKLIFLNKIRQFNKNNKNNNIMGPKKFVKPDELDINFYRQTYPDLHNKTDEQLINTELLSP
jgi:hypothetical protein